MINIPFDIIGISETKQQINKDFLVNVDMQAYSMVTQPSKNSCGGCAIYVNSQLDYLVRNDLSALEEEYETSWVEINNHKAEKFSFLLFIQAYFKWCFPLLRSSDFSLTESTKRE